MLAAQTPRLIPKYLNRNTCSRSCVVRYSAVTPGIQDKFGDFLVRVAALGKLKPVEAVVHTEETDHQNQINSHCGTRIHRQRRTASWAQSLLQR